MNAGVMALLVGALFAVVGRAFVPGHGLSWAGSYEAIAHIWVGSAFTVAVCPKFTPNTRLIATGLLIGATLVEVGGFLTRG